MIPPLLPLAVAAPGLLATPGPLAAPGSGAPGAAALRAGWTEYVHAFIQSDGRVIDRAGADVSTSEGQAYALVRAVWCNDRRTFDTVLHWTLSNLQASEPDRLPAWKWGQRQDGTWGVLDAVPAADADQWIAWALLLAADRWKAPAYRGRALGLLPRIWDEETLQIGARRVLLPGPWAKGQDPVQVNPSYWLPFAWRRFATADPGHDWTGMVGDAYAFWDACRSPSGLPPDWCWLNPEDGHAVDPPAGKESTRAFGYEAFRIGWTLAAEYRWHTDVRAKRHLEAFGVLGDGWLARRPIPAVIEPDGRAREAWGYLGLYGALLPALAAVRPPIAEAIYRDEIRRPSPSDGGMPATSAGADYSRDYYAHNWVWLGLALWSGLATP